MGFDAPEGAGLLKLPSLRRSDALVASSRTTRIHVGGVSKHRTIVGGVPQTSHNRHAKQLVTVTTKRNYETKL